MLASVIVIVLAVSVLVELGDQDDGALKFQQTTAQEAPVLPENLTRAEVPGLADTLDRMIEKNLSHVAIRDSDTFERYCTFLEGRDLPCLGGSVFRYRGVTFRVITSSQ